MGCMLAAGGTKLFYLKFCLFFLAAGKMIVPVFTDRAGQCYYYSVAHSISPNIVKYCQNIVKAILTALDYS